jgi:thioredoxin-dependent peroxiredoxin
MRFLLAASFFVSVLASDGSHVADAGGKGKGKDKPKVELKMKAGDPAPSFESVDESGKPFKSSEIVGKKTVVLFFFPADFTGNSVAQVHGYQSEIESLTKAGAVVLGVSGDSAATHMRFKAYYKLPFSLLADEKGELAKAFGIPVGKGGKSPTIDDKDKKGEADRAVTIERVTVVIDRTGKIAAIDAVSKNPGDDGKRVVEIAKKLEKK